MIDSLKKTMGDWWRRRRRQEEQGQLPRRQGKAQTRQRMSGLNDACQRRE